MGKLFAVRSDANVFENRKTLIEESYNLVAGTRLRALNFRDGQTRRDVRFFVVTQDLNVIAQLLGDVDLPLYSIAFCV